MGTIKDSRIHQLSTFSIAAFVLVACPFVALSQVPAEKCRGPVYDRKDVTKPAIVREQPDFHTLFEALGAQTPIHVTLDAVLCRSGRVTDIKVTKSEPPNAAEWVVGAVSLITFSRAELNWHTVSQKQTFDFRFNQRGTPRLVDEVDIVGNRRLTKEEILAWIKVRPGDPYDADQINKDFQAVLGTGFFDKLHTRVTVEDAIRGGVRIIFELVELPLIREVNFVGLRAETETSFIREWERQGVRLRRGTPFDPAKAKIAAKIIEQMLQSRGWINAKAEASTEFINPSEVRIVFTVTR